MSEGRFEWAGSDIGMDTALIARRNGDASVTVSTRCGSRLQSVWLPRADARRLREWLCAQDLGPTHEERMRALAQFMVEFVAEFGPLTDEDVTQARAILPDGDSQEPSGPVFERGTQRADEFIASAARSLPKSMGMGKGGPADLSQREGFGG